METLDFALTLRWPIVFGFCILLLLLMLLLLCFVFVVGILGVGVRCFALILFKHALTVKNTATLHVYALD